MEFVKTSNKLFKNIDSTWSMKIHTYIGADLGPIAGPEICCLVSPLNSGTNLAILTRSDVEKDSLFPRAYSNAFKPSSWGILGIKSTTSAVFKPALSGILPILLIFVYKIPWIFDIRPVPLYHKFQMVI